MEHSSLEWNLTDVILVPSTELDFGLQLIFAFP